MKKTSLFVLSWFVLGSIAAAEKLAILEDPGGARIFPTDLAVNDEQIYIRHEYRDPLTLYIYSMKNYKYLARAGEDGSGFEYIKGEFAIVPSFEVLEDRVRLSSRGKLSIFDREGNPIEEKTLPEALQESILHPLGKNYAVMQNSRDEEKKKTRSFITLYDDNLNVVKVLCEREEEILPFIENGRPVMRLFRPTMLFEVNANKLIVGDSSKGFYFAVFDETGNLINEIDFEFEKRLVTEEEKQKATLGDAIHYFPEHYPAFYSFELFENRIFAHTYPVTEPPELTILDLNGKLIKKLTLPECTQHTVYKDHLYYLKNNENDELELHAIKLY